MRGEFEGKMKTELVAVQAGGGVEKLCQPLYSRLALKLPWHPRTNQVFL